ncbi:MAG: efflux RND transporter periplasmic adaptor subunit [Desulfobacteraceae bacterium]
MSMSTYGRFGWKIVKIGLMAAGVIYIAVSGYRYVSEREQNETQEPVYQTEKVVRGDLETLVSSTGTIAAVGTVDIGTQVSGTIDKVFVDYNDKVKKDQVLALLDLSLFESSVIEAKANVMEATAKLKQAELECVRNKPLADSGNLSAQEWLSLETEKSLAQAGLLSAQAALKKSKTNLDNARIRSPIDGTVITRDIEEGQTVAASYSTPTLFVIAEDLSRVEIEANVDESDIGQIQVKQLVRFTVQAYPDDIFKGKVTQIRMKPTTISNVVTYTVVVDAGNEKGYLLPGMTATVDFIVAKAENALLIPTGALRFKPDNGVSNNKSGSGGEKGHVKREHGPRVFTLDPAGEPLKLAVKPGISDGTQTVLAEDGDVKEGMVVITGAKAEKAKAKTNLFSKLAPQRPGKSHGTSRGMR